MIGERGFNFLEMLICISLISILIGMSIVNFSPYVLRGHRIEASILLTKLAMALEKYQLSYDSYEGATLNVLQFPEIIANHSYRLFVQASKFTYVIGAIPIGRQQQDACKILKLDAKGNRSHTGVVDCDGW